MTAELAEIEGPAESVLVEASKEKEDRVVEVNRVVQAILHFNERDRDPRAMWYRDWLRRQLILVGRAEAEALKLLRSCLDLIRNEKEEIIRVELLIPPARGSDLVAARKLLTDKENFSPKPIRPPSARQLVQPVYSNSYRLVEVARRENKDFLRFVLLEKYSYLADKGKKVGQEVTAVTKLPIKFLQRIITRWLRPPLFDKLLPVLKNGAAQEVAQLIGSHLGLDEEGSQPNVGFPSMDDTDPRLAHQNGRSVKIQPGLFVNSSDVVVYLRRWREEKRPRVALYAALPITPDRETTIGVPIKIGGKCEHRQVPLDSFWWSKHLDEFSNLPAWPDKKLTMKSWVSLTPLHFSGCLRRLRRAAEDWQSSEHRTFVRALSGRNEICWSRLVYRDGEFILQITVKRSVELIPRPNVLGIHITQIQVEDNIHTRLFWSCLASDGHLSLHSGFIEVDTLPIGLPRHLWPGQKERKRLAYLAAREVVALADQHNADLVVEEVKGVPKRGRNCDLRNRLGTSFNFSDLAQFISDKALNHPRPVRVWRVPGFKVLEQKKQGDSPRHLADLVASQGWQIRERVLSRR